MMAVRGQVAARAGQDRSGVFAGSVTGGTLRLDHTTLPEVWMEVDMSQFLGDQQAQRKLPADHIRGRVATSEPPHGDFIGIVTGSPCDCILRIDHGGAPEFSV